MEFAEEQQERGDQLITIQEIAEKLNMSPTTVSRALSGKGRISSETRERVEEFLKTNHYKPNRSPRPGTERKTYNICVTLPYEEDYAQMQYFQTVLLSCYDFFAAKGYNIIMIKTSTTDITSLRSIVAKKKVDGVILTRAASDGTEIKFLQQRGVPFVLIGNWNDNTVWQVDVDHTKGCSDLTSTLLRMQMERIALMCGDIAHTVTSSRLKGVQEAFREFGKEIDKDFFYTDTEYPEVAEKAVKELLTKRVECILCLDDNICANILNALRKEKISVPKRVRVATCYNSKMLNNYYPAVTCLEFNIQELGIMASRSLFNILQGDTVPKRLVLGYDIMIKASTR